MQSRPTAAMMNQQRTYKNFNQEKKIKCKKNLARKHKYGNEWEFELHSPGGITGYESRNCMNGKGRQVEDSNELQVYIWH